MSDTEAEKAKPLIARLRKNLKSKMEAEPVKVTFIFGVVTFEIAPQSAAQMIREADALMYRVKK